MKLDYDCIRHILLKIESLDETRIYIDDIANEVYDLPTISYHVKLLLDVGYIEATHVPIVRELYEQFIIKRMTMKGHEYVDTVRNDNIWTNTKNELKKLSGTTSLDIIKTVATKLSLKMLGL